MGWSRHTFLKKPLHYLRWYFTLRNSAEKNLHTWKFWKIFLLDPLELSRPKIKTYENYTWLFSDHFWRLHFFFNWSLEFPHALSSIHLDVLCSKPHICLDFSGIASSNFIIQKMSQQHIIWQKMVFRWHLTTIKEHQ